MAAPQQQNAPDNSASVLWGVAGLFGGLGFIWLTFKSTIIKIFLHIKYYEASFLSLFSASHFDPVKQVIVSAINNPNAVTFNELITMGNFVGDTLRYPLAIVLVILAVLVYAGNTTRVFRRVYNMKELAELEKQNWPQITPVIGLDLLKQNIDVGPWAMAMTPVQFCKRYNLVEEFRQQRVEGMSRKDWDRIHVRLNKGEANKIFALQLGPLFRNVESLTPHAKALFAVFAARLNADSKPALEMLKRLSASSSGKGKLDMTGVDELIKKHLNSKGVQQILASHAYVMTVMASMLAGAREDGVQASADFLWLKPIDRKLWYTLNTVGRQTPFAEVAGIFAHWTAEKEAGHKLIMPIVEEATRGLEIALQEIVYKREEA